MKTRLFLATKVIIFVKNEYVDLLFVIKIYAQSSDARKRSDNEENLSNIFAFYRSLNCLKRYDIAFEQQLFSVDAAAAVNGASLK